MNRRTIPVAAEQSDPPHQETSKKDEFKKPKLRVAAMVAAAVLIAAGAYVDFVAASIDQFSGERILLVLGLLLLISLFIERGLEFFVELWRGLEKGLRETDISNRNAEISRLREDSSADQTRLEDLYNQLRDKKRDLREYQAITHRISLWASFLFGLLLSIAGVRCLEWLLDTSVFVEENQKIIFRAVDTIFTACLISGGSEGLHKVMSAYNDFFDTTRTLSQSRRDGVNRGSPRS